MEKFVIRDSFGEPLKRVPFDEQRGLAGANLDGMAAPGAHLQGQKLSGANLSCCHLAGADLSFPHRMNDDVRGASLDGACVRGAKLRDANRGRNALGGAARLRGTDLSTAILDGAELDGAEYDDSTIFPTGFDPEARGMLKAGES